MADEADKDEVKEKKAPSTMKIVLIAVILASLLSGGIVGVTMLLLGDDSSEEVAQAETEEADEGEEGEEDEEADNEGPALYHRMDPKFIVSFRDQRIARFMQFSIQIMTRDKKVIEQIKEHNPAIRSSLLLLFDNQTAEQMKTREGKEQLLLAITTDINNSLETLADTSGVEASYFESFLIQ